MITAKPDPIDARLGELLRLARLLCGISQERLGAMSGLTFQQIQKYERGQNRVSVSRLIHMAAHLGVSAKSFIEKLVEESPIERQNLKTDLSLLNRRESQDLLRAYAKIADKDERRFLRLMTTLLADRTSGGSNAQ